MSWSKSVYPQVAKGDVPAVLADLILGPNSHDPVVQAAMEAQFEAAKPLVLAMLETVPGPYVTITMSGHANGVGEVSKPGWSNDSLTVSMQQWTEPAVVETPASVVKPQEQPTEAQGVDTPGMAP